MLESSPVRGTVSADVPQMPPPSIPGRLVPDGVPVDAAGVPAGEACPPPLIWQEVLKAYHADSQPWELDRGSHRLIGRTWGQGPPLYLLNGFASTAEMYGLMMYLLRDQFRCVVFDTAVKSDSRKTPPTVNDFAGDLLAAMDLHGDAAACVFAASSGTVVALQAALDRPERFAGLALQQGFASRRLSWLERRLARWYRTSNQTLQALPWRRRIQELNHRRWFPPFDGTRFEFLVQSTGQIPLADLARTALAVHSADLRSRLGQVQAPVLLIQSEGQGTRETAAHDVLMHGLSRARTEWLHSTGLHPYLTHPHRLAKLLKSFFLGDGQTDATR